MIIYKSLYPNCWNQISKLCIRLIFKGLFLKLTNETSYIFNSEFYKQSDGSSMGWSLSVSLSNIYWAKLEIDKVRPMKPLFYMRSLGDANNRRKKNTPDSLLTSLNCYHPNINFTVEANPSWFLDSNIKIVNGKVEISVYGKPNNMPVHWISKFPNCY